MSARVVTLALVAVIAWGCDSTWQSKVVQPRLALGSQTQRTSYPLVIRIGDMDFPRFCRKRGWVTVSCWNLGLENTAYFFVVSKDRMRFHVTLQHKWEAIADPTRWRVRIEDDAGNLYHPEGIDRRSVRPVTQMWSTRGTDHKAPLYSITVWRGDGDYVFHEPNLFRKDMSRMTLVLERPGYTYRYEWQFVHDAGDGAIVAVERIRSDDEALLVSQ